MLRRKHNAYAESVVLITGGTGSIGLEISKSLLNLGIKKLRLFSNDENGLFEAQTILGQDSRIEYRLGDVRDPKAVQSAIEGCDVVFHAAALKHVIFCEENPSEAISTNILGTQNLLDNALRSSVQKFVFISTDKAVNPINTMGATKLLAEKLTLNASKMSREKTLCCVRFGNVLGTRGSVLRIFERQIRTDSSITLRNPEMTRFIMLPSDASRLVVLAGEMARSGETFVLEMPAVRLGDLATASIKYFAKLYQKDQSQIKIKRFPSNPGEKFHEELMTVAECRRAIRRGRFHVIPAEPNNQPASKGTYYSDNRGYTSNSVPLLSISEITSLLRSFKSEESHGLKRSSDSTIFVN
jgi:UDP-N-acetylglucosamine 4,6-dehydratase